MRGEFNIDGRIVKVNVLCVEYINGENLSDLGVEYIRNILKSEFEIEKYAAIELIYTYNDTWSEVRVITEKEFIDEISISSIGIIDEPGYATIYIKDGDLFGGHYIAVDCNGLIPSSVNIMG